MKNAGWVLLALGMAWSCGGETPANSTASSEKPVVAVDEVQEPETALELAPSGDTDSTRQGASARKHARTQDRLLGTWSIDLRPYALPERLRKKDRGLDASDSASARPRSPDTTVEFTESELKVSAGETVDVKQYEIVEVDWPLVTLELRDGDVTTREKVEFGLHGIILSPDRDPLPLSSRRVPKTKKKNASPPTEWAAQEASSPPIAADGRLIGKWVPDFPRLEKTQKFDEMPEEQRKAASDALRSMWEGAYFEFTATELTMSVASNDMVSRYEILEIDAQSATLRVRSGGAKDQMRITFHEGGITMFADTNPFPLVKAP